MTLDLDELERKAKFANTPPVSSMAIDPVVVLALIERVRDLEADRHTVAHELGCTDDAAAYAAGNAVARIRSLEAALDRAYNRKDR